MVCMTHRWREMDSNHRSPVRRLAPLKQDSEIVLIPKNWRRLTRQQPRRVHSSGTPSLRRPAKYTDSYNARILGGPQYPVTRMSAIVDTQSFPLSR